ncbi:MAG: ArsR family transcriptional regulator [Bacteroidota bacterium]
MKLKKGVNIENSDRAIKVAEVADALAHPLRVALIAYVKQKNTVRNDICNKDLVAHFPYSQSSLSQHVKKLKDANLFKVEYKDKYSFYSVNVEQIDSFIEELKAL